jgi:hypothetical protein
MPHPNNHGFVGRETPLEELHQAITSIGSDTQTAAQVQVLHGLGGIGKTQLAVRYA